ncbi:MAG: sterol desaturase family protein [Myxococcota bacterium]
MLLFHPAFQADPQRRLSFLFDEIQHYLLFAAGAFVLFWLVLDRPLARRKLARHPRPALGQVISESVFSIASKLVMVATSMWISYVAYTGGAADQRYTDLAEYGYAYYGFTLFAVFFVHDTWFYWFHRLMHRPELFRTIHRTHHESRDPTPFTTFHFHPLEAVLEGVAGKAIILPLMLLPWHTSVPIVWASGMVLFNTIAHLGYEVYPSWWHRVPILSGKTTAMHHYLHHQRVAGNYALYFRFWDRLCGTEFPDFEARYADRFRREARPPTAPQPTAPQPPTTPAPTTPPAPTTSTV